MDFQQLVFERFSCREFQEKDIPEDLLIELFEICRFAPSAANFQPWEFIVLKEKDSLRKAFGSYSNAWIRSAPVLVIAIGDKDTAWVRHDGKNHVDIDLAILIDHLTLVACEKGLATCWVCNFNVKHITREFGLPDNKIPIALIPLGYAVNNPKPKKRRKQVSDFVYFNAYCND